MTQKEPIYGLLAAFATPQEMLEAARQARRDGWRCFDCHSPWPLDDAVEALGTTGSRLPLFALLGGLLGGVLVFALEAWSSMSAYPLNIGGRPLFSWPAFIVPAFEGTILGAGLATLVGMLALNRLPMLWHPLFNSARFRGEQAGEKFFLCLEARDPKFEAASARAFLESFHPLSIEEVEA